MVQTFCTCTVWGEPLSQTGQSFIPELLYRVDRNLSGHNASKVSRHNWTYTWIVIMSCMSVPFLFLYIFTQQMVIREVSTFLISLYFYATNGHSGGQYLSYLPL